MCAPLLANATSCKRLLSSNYITDAFLEKEKKHTAHQRLFLFIIREKNLSRV